MRCSAALTLWRCHSFLMNPIITAHLAWWHSHVARRSNQPMAERPGRDLIVSIVPPNARDCQRPLPAGAAPKSLISQLGAVPAAEHSLWPEVQLGNGRKRRGNALRRDERPGAGPRTFATARCNPG